MIYILTDEQTNPESKAHIGFMSRLFYRSLNSRKKVVLFYCCYYSTSSVETPVESFEDLQISLLQFAGTDQSSSSSTERLFDLRGVLSCNV